MEYYYCWDGTPVDLHSPPVPFGVAYVDHPYFGRFVRLRGTAVDWCVQEGEGGPFHWLAWVPGKVGGCRVRLAADVPMAQGVEIAVVGRVVVVHDGPCTADGKTKIPLCVEPNASRFHPASIAGLAVGVMGVFVFTMYFREWLNRQRATR